MTDLLARVPPLTRIGLVVALALLIGDQVSKYFFHEIVNLPQVGQIRVLPVFNFTMVWNTGVSFGIFGSGPGLVRWLLALFQLAVSGVVLWWLWRAERPLLAIGLGMVLGGALGNVIDRVRFGAVFDFLDFSGLGFPWVFNVADAAISLGVVVLVYDSFFDKREADPKADRPGGEHS